MNVKWNSKGHIYGLSYDDACALAASLGSMMLSVRDFMHLAVREPRVASPHFAEWLSGTYELSKTGETLDHNGNNVDTPVSRPGWFNLSDIGGCGNPRKRVSSNEEGLWKFWTPGSSEWKSAAVRSYVTSSGTCSLDLGIPTFAKHPMMMLRECYPAKRSIPVSPINKIWHQYEAVTHSKDNKKIRDFLTSIDSPSLVQQTDGLESFLMEKEQEMAVDILGKRTLLLGQFSHLKKLSKADMMSTLKRTTQEATTMVIGHPHPDADSIVTAVYEATRRVLVHKKEVCLPWCERVPNEVEHILGPVMSRLLGAIDAPSDLHDIVLVDCHETEEKFVPRVRAVMDHHIIRATLPYYVALSQEVSWSSTIQVYIKLLGSGFDLDARTATILLEATLLEAEPDLMVLMSEVDRLALARLQGLASQPRSYAALMGVMTQTKDRKARFYKDYKESLYGFAVIKCTNTECYEKLAKANNKFNGLPLTVVKEVNYTADFTAVISENISFYFNDSFHDKGFHDAVNAIVRFACSSFHGCEHVTADKDRVIILDVPYQTPRLLLMPLIDDIVREHLRFRFSTSLGKYVSCGFYGGTEATFGEVQQDGDTVKSSMSYAGVKELLHPSRNTSFMSLSDYWKVYHELASRKDAHALRSLRDSTHVELLDTIIRQKSIISSHGSSFRKANILEATPALIRPDDIDCTTGLPACLTAPNTYGDPTLWRYWSPDAEVNVATRGHIFIMDQTCIDLKITPQCRTQRSTFRPVYNDVRDIRYDVARNGERWISLQIHPRLFSVEREEANE